MKITLRTILVRLQKFITNTNVPRALMIFNHEIVKPTFSINKLEYVRFESSRLRQRLSFFTIVLFQFLKDKLKIFISICGAVYLKFMTMYTLFFWRGHLKLHQLSTRACARAVMFYTLKIFGSNFLNLRHLLKPRTGIYKWIQYRSYSKLFSSKS